MTLLQGSATDSLFWTAYASAVKKILGDVGKNQLFLRSFTQPWILPAGKPISAEVTNYLVYNLTNVVLAVETGKDGGSYVQELSSYLSWVETAAHPESKDALDKAADARQKAIDAYNNEYTKAKALYDDLFAELPGNKPSFQQWAAANYPQLAAAEKTKSSTETQYNQAQTYYWGRTKELNPLLQKIQDAQDQGTYHPSLNMPVTKPEQGSVQTAYSPVYTASGLNDQLNNWIQNSGQLELKKVFEIKIDSTSPPSAENKDAGASKEDGIYLEMWAKGLQKFDLLPGGWNVANVKKLFPTLRSGAPKLLDSNFTRPTSFLLGYDVQLKLTIKQGSDGPLIKTFTSDDDGGAAAYPVVLAIVGQPL